MGITNGMKVKTMIRLVSLILVLPVVAVLVWLFIREISDPPDLPRPVTIQQRQVWCQDCREEGILINLHAEPHGTARITGKVLLGAICELHRRTTGKDGRLWYKLDCGMQEGWVPIDFVRSVVKMSSAATLPCPFRRCGTARSLWGLLEGYAGRKR